MALTNEEKRQIGGSDVAAILGMSPYKTPIDVWQRCVNEQNDTDDASSFATRRGTLIEPVIRQLAVEEFGLDLQGPRKLTDPQRPYVRASLDDVAIGPDGLEVVEFKSVGSRAWHHYAAGEYPVWHELQVQFYMAELGAKRAQLIAMMGVDEIKRHLIDADAELQAMIFDAVDSFWTHVASGNPPPPDASDAYRDFLAARYPVSKDQLVQATPEMNAVAFELRDAREAKEWAEQREKLARNRLLKFIGDADGVNGDGWRVTYRTTKGRATTDWAAVCFEAQVPKSIIDAHTTRKPYRVFKPNFGKDNHE